MNFRSAFIIIIIIFAGLMYQITPTYASENTNGEPRYPFKLLGTILESDSRGSIAIIKDINSKKQCNYRVGDKISDYQIAKITRGAVTLLKNGKIFLLDFPLGSEAEPVITVSAEERIVNLASLTEKISDLNMVMSHALVIPHIESGKIKGFKIMQVKNNSLVKLTGLKEGDIITKINGQSLDSLRKPIEMYQHLRNQEKIDLEITRGRDIKNLIYYFN